MKTLSLIAMAAVAVLSAFQPAQVQADTVDGKSSTKDLVWVARSTSDGGELFVSWAHGAPVPRWPIW
ncbi:hypothetical protein [Verrucomicrobium spinosum]|uniref:hypothetical protein n=1 Tax=Verrucomicrobium spinosum TaxID=2736 RepID=UPI000ACE701E|nr:hypothetical protein [Verrucomicrobium spinosum]